MAPPAKPFESSLRRAPEASWVTVKKFYSEPPPDESTRQASVAERESRKLSVVQPHWPYLIVISGSNVGEMFRLGEMSIIGRAPGADVRILDDDASRQH